VSKFIETAGNSAAILGLLLCLAAMVVRATGSYYMGGYAAMTVFNVGVGLMVAACLAKLHILQGR
jgi:hypothetical protein